MIRVFLAALFVLSSATVGRSNPVDNQVTLSGGTVHVADKWSWKDCGSPEDPIQIQSIQVTPDPPQPGKDLTVKVVGNATETILEGAYANVTVKLGLIKLLQKEFDVCEEARNAHASVQCPIEPDSYTVEQTVALPKEIPRAKFVVNVKGYTVEDDPMLCLELHVDFMKNPFPHWGS